jgi:superfamily II DNA or RNA helicase
MSAMLPLRSYQTEAITELHRRWDAGDTRVPMVLATGLGKTVIFAHLIADWVQTHVAKRVIVLVHTDELVQQAYKKIKDVAPHLKVGIVKAERNEVTARVIVASVQSLRSAKRRQQIRNVGMIIVDECHHAVAKTYRDILKHYGALASSSKVQYDTGYDDQGLREYVSEAGSQTGIGAVGAGSFQGAGAPSNAQRSIGDGDADDLCGRDRRSQGRELPRVVVAGFTATLARGDRQKLSDIWQECTFQRGIAFGIRRGYLLDVRGKRIVVPDLDLSTVKKSGGDYQDAALGDAMDAALAPSVIAEAYKEHAADRKGLAFWPLVETARHGMDSFNAIGIPSALVHGGTPREERRLILKKLHAGDIQVVHNCGVLTEGFDEPTVSCVVNARPTQSAPLYQQMVGRGLRPDLSLPPEARGDCLVLDVVGVSRTHNLRTLIDLSSRADDGFTDEDLDGMSLLEMEDAAELAEAENGHIEPEEYYGTVTAEDFDPLARTGIGAWLQTSGGTYFLPVGKEAYVLLVPAEEPNRWDVAWLTQHAGVFLHTGCPGMDTYVTATRGCNCGAGHEGSQGDLTEHRGLSLDMATSWAEEVLEELGGSTALLLAGAKKRWRKSEPSAAQISWCARRGIDATGLTKGEVSDRMSTVIGSGRIDPVVGFMLASRGEL